MLYDSHYNDNQQIVNIEYVKIKRRRSMKAANVAEAVKSEHAVALLKQRSVETIPTITTEKFWQEAYIWTVWQPLHRTELIP